MAEVGVAIVTPGGRAGIAPYLPLNFSVVNEQVILGGLTVVVYTGAVWETPELSTYALGDAAEPRLQLKSSLTAEGQRADVVCYAEYLDGNYEDVTDEVDLSLLDQVQDSLAIEDGQLVVKENA